MLKTAEAVSLGHPDKTADYISSYLLDRMVEQDPSVRYAVEVLLKGNTVVLGGEVSGKAELRDLRSHVLAALAEIGYTEAYARRWGGHAIEPEKLTVVNLIHGQSAEIGQGVTSGGWGDQGVFVGYACQGEGLVSRELFLSRKLNRALYQKALSEAELGLDIKTQVTVDERGGIVCVVAAVPMLEEVDLVPFIAGVLAVEPERVIVNGTGRYCLHSSVADCGVTGRKLACDFYGTAAPIGGGSPWTKDATKADLTLNLYARYLAKQYLEDNDECFVYLSSCIGRAKLPSAELIRIKGGKSYSSGLDIELAPAEIIHLLGLDKPGYARLCREGLV